jgi:hypothetical protein
VARPSASVRRVLPSDAPASPDRRRLLKRGLVDSAPLLVGGAVPLALRSTLVRRPPARPLKLLRVEEHAVLAAVAARFAPGDGAAASWPSADALDCAGKVDALMATVHPAVGAEFRQLLGLFESALFGLFTTGSPTPFTRLAPAAQDARLEAWRRSRLAVLRSGYQALKRLCHATYYSSPEVYGLLGYPGPPEVPRGPS